MLADHDSISVGQAVFTSSHGSHGRGYRLVARSSGLRESLVKHLARWGPAHGSLLMDAPDGSCFNYIPFDSEWATISRTLYGGPEYSCRGALQVVTFILVLPLKELAAYNNNPITFARTAMLLGYLRLSANVSEQLPNVHLPAQPPNAVVDPPEAVSSNNSLLKRCLQRLNQGQQIALLDMQSASRNLEKIFFSTPTTNRLELSFTTGLKPSPDRRFRIHVLPFVNPQIHRQLSALGIRFVAT